MIHLREMLSPAQAFLWWVSWKGDPTCMWHCLKASSFECLLFDTFSVLGSFSWSVFVNALRLHCSTNNRYKPHSQSSLKTLSRPPVDLQQPASAAACLRCQLAYASGRLEMRGEAEGETNNWRQGTQGWTQRLCPSPQSTHYTPRRQPQPCRWPDDEGESGRPSSWALLQLCPALCFFQEAALWWRRVYTVDSCRLCCGRSSRPCSNCRQGRVMGRSGDQSRCEVVLIHSNAGYWHVPAQTVVASWG